MWGGTLALLIRSLRVESRLLRTHLFRFGFAGLICLLLFWAQMMSWAFGAPGLRFFQSITYLNFFLITLAGIGFFATAITEEKEEATLGLLKMAGISRAGILLGKSTSRLISAMLLLLVQLPFILLAITLGGVTFGQVTAAYWGLLAYMALVANLGLLWSVWCRRSGSGTGAAMAAETFFGRLADASMFGRINVIMTTGFAEQPFSFQVVSNLAAAAVVLFVLSWVTFDLFTNERTSSAPSRGLVLRPTGRLRILGTGRVWRNAMMWKDFYFLTGGRLVMAAKFILYGVIVTAIGISTTSSLGSPNWQEFGAYASGVMTTALAIELSIYSARIFHEEIKWKTLPAISMLPVSTAHIAYSKVAGCLLGLAPVVTYLALGTVLNPLGNLEVILSPFTWFGLVTFAIFLHLTAYLSLFVKWGALPLSLAIMFVFNNCCPVFSIGLMIAMLSSETGWGAVISLILILIYGGVILFPMQIVIAKRLRTVASQ